MNRPASTAPNAQLPLPRDFGGFLARQPRVTPEEQGRILAWVRRFAHAPPGVSLIARSAADFKAFRGTLERDEQTRSAQVEEAVAALRLLYRFLRAAPEPSQDKAQAPEWQSRLRTEIYPARRRPFPVGRADSLRGAANGTIAP